MLWGVQFRACLPQLPPAAESTPDGDEAAAAESTPDGDEANELQSLLQEDSDD